MEGPKLDKPVELRVWSFWSYFIIPIVLAVKFCNAFKDAAETGFSREGVYAFVAWTLAIIGIGAFVWTNMRRVRLSAKGIQEHDRADTFLKWENIAQDQDRLVGLSKGPVPLGSTHIGRNDALSLWRASLVPCHFRSADSAGKWFEFAGRPPFDWIHLGALWVLALVAAVGAQRDPKLYAAAFLLVAVSVLVIALDFYRTPRDLMIRRDSGDRGALFTGGKEYPAQLVGCFGSADNRAYGRYVELWKAGGRTYKVDPRFLYETGAPQATGKLKERSA